MLNIEEKILVHFDSNYVSSYSLKGGVLNKLGSERLIFEKDCNFENLSISLDYFFVSLEKNVGKLDNERIRLYATGMFQTLTQEEQNKLTIHVFVNSGLYFNIIKQDLEKFYLEKGLEYGSEEMVVGVVSQEFRRVVVCGSFQQHLKDIGDIMNLLYKRNVQVLSPWTTQVVQETLGTDFILLEGQEPLKNERDAWKHKYEHMDKFRSSDAIIICNPDGIVGKGTMFEFGFMVAYSKRIIFIKEPKDLSILFPYEIGLNF